MLGDACSMQAVLRKYSLCNEYNVMHPDLSGSQGAFLVQIVPWLCRTASWAEHEVD